MTERISMKQIGPLEIKLLQAILYEIHYNRGVASEIGIFWMLILHIDIEFISLPTYELVSHVLRIDEMS